MQPTRPQHLPDFAELCLDALAARGLGHKISLGGALGLLHYLDYRSTHDVDAWWEASASEEDRKEVADVLRATLAATGEVRIRTWGEVVSIELKRGGRKIFSFQVAHRAARLEPSARAPWTDVLLDSFDDLVANKMVALVERGAPRDFRDIYALCQAGLVTPAVCWQLWQRRQQLAENDTDPRRARLAVETHLSRIVRHRPLNLIPDPAQRAEAEQARIWYKTELLDALPVD